MSIRSFFAFAVIVAATGVPFGLSAQTLRELRADFPGQSGRHPCLPASPTAVSAPFAITGPGTLVIQDWLMPVRSPRVADSNGGAALYLPGLRRLSGQLTQIPFAMRTPDPMIDGQPGYSETHRTVGENSHFEDVTIRIEPYTFGLDCIQFAQVRQVIVSFYPEGIAAPRAGQAEINAGFAALGATDAASDMSGWTVDHARVEVSAAEIRSWPADDGYSSFFHAPDALLGDLSDVVELVFEKRSEGGTQYQERTGDVVISGSAGTARYEIDFHHTGEWRRFRVPFSGPGWELDAGSGSLEAILNNVTGLAIRAEYGAGPDSSALRAVQLVRAGDAVGATVPAVPGK